MKIGNYEIHPLCALFPWMDQKTFDTLKEDMKKEGQRDTIKIFQGMVLDGKNRLRCCIEIGIEPNIEILPDDTNLIAYIKAVGLCRRDLTPDQRIDIAEEIEEYRKEQKGLVEIVEEIKKEGNQKKVIEYQEAVRIAKEANSNIKTVQLYKEIKMNAKESPEAKNELKKIKDGKSTITQSYKKIFKTPEKQKSIKNIPMEPTNGDLRAQIIETKHELVYLQNIQKQLIAFIKDKGLWNEIKHILNIIDRNGIFELSPKEMREAELL